MTRADIKAELRRSAYEDEYVRLTPDTMDACGIFFGWREIAARGMPMEQ